MKLRRVLGIFALVILGPAALYAAAALGLGALTVNQTFTQTPGGVAIAVCSNGVHTDFVLPVRTADVDWSQFFPRADFASPFDRFDQIGIGWGDLAFYKSTPRWRDFNLGIALRAAAGLGPAALHVQYRPAPLASEDCARLTISAAQYRRLTEFITGTLGADLTPVAAGYGASDAFFTASGHFSLFKTCNAWVGQGLRTAGLPAGVWTPLAFQVLSPLRTGTQPGPETP
jgi:uncharacterized protein (TIGR02117 family)